jgi:hypothetical protein
MIADEVVDVIAMRHRVVSASWSVHVLRIVSAARMTGLAVRRVGRVDRDHTLVDMVVVCVVKMAIVQVVDVTVVLDGRMTAVGAVDMLVPLVNRVRVHCEVLS